MKISNYIWLQLTNYHNRHHRQKSLFNSENTFTERNHKGLQIIHDTNLQIQLSYPWRKWLPSTVKMCANRGLPKMASEKTHWVQFSWEFLNSYWTFGSWKKDSCKHLKYSECWITNQWCTQEFLNTTSLPFQLSVHFQPPSSQRWSKAAKSKPVTSNCFHTH